MLDKHSLVYLIHFVLFGPLMIYIGYVEKPIESIKMAVLALGVVATLYHGYKFVLTLQSNQSNQSYE